MSDNEIHTPNTPRTYTAELETPLPRSRERHVSRSDVGALMAAVRAHAPLARQVSNEDLEQICWEAFYQGKERDLAWMNKELRKHIPTTPPPALHIIPEPELPVPVQNGSTETIDSDRCEPETIAPEPRPAVPAKAQVALASSSAKPKSKPSQEMASTGKTTSNSSLTKKLQDPGPIDLKGVLDHQGNKDKVDPLASVQPSRPQPIKNQAQLNAILDRHRCWKESVLSTRLELAGGRANLEHADLEGLSLEGCDLSIAILRGARLVGCNMRGCNLSGADLTSACLQGADLSHAKLRRAKLNKADFTGATLKGVDMRDAILTDTIFDPEPEPSPETGTAASEECGQGACKDMAAGPSDLKSETGDTPPDRD